jgi:RHS repeat-associated protein
MEYGPFDVPTAYTGPDGARMDITCDAELKVTAVTNPQGSTWRYEYDPAGNLVRETDFNGRTLAYGFDAAGQLVSRTHALGETVTLVRDALGNVTEERSASETATFAYDEAGWLIQATNANADVRFQRDLLGRILSETCNGQVVASSYNAAGQRLRRRTPSGAESTWAFDAAGRPASLTTGGHVIGFERDPFGREVRRRLGAEAMLVQQWDAGNQLRTQTLWGAPASPGTEPRLLQHRAYTYRADGPVTSISDRLGGDRRFDLDPLGQVTQVHTPQGTERFAYDTAGNLTEAGREGAREYGGTLILRASGGERKYDADGRVTVQSLGGRTWYYYWDVHDRLIDVRTPDQQRWHYRYDALGRRITKQLLTPDGTGVLEQIDFVWDGYVLAEQTHRVWSPERQRFIARCTSWEYEPETFRPLTQTERVPATDTFGAGTAADASTSQKWFDERFDAIVTDLVGTPTELVDVSGNVTEHVRTSLWGGTTGTRCPLRFPGQYHDEETGLHYNHHRYYNPVDGRYQSADPLGLMAGPNPYAYVPNPLTWLDPLGLKGGEEKVKVYHYTDKPGFNGIRSSDPYHVREGSSKNGPGPFFTTKSPNDLTEPGAFKKLGITNAKSQYVMEAEVPKSALVPLRGDRGQFIFMTPGGIKIPRADSRYFGPTSDWTPG